MSTFPIRLGALCAVALALLAGTAAHATESDDATLHAAVITEQARAPAPRFDRSAFMARPAIAVPSLSPDGRQVAYLRQQGRKRSVWLLPTDDGAPRQLLGQTDAAQLDWSHDGRWLLVESPGQLFALATQGQGGSGMVSTLGGREHRELVTVDPVQPAAVIIRERTPATLGAAERWRLVRVDMHGKRTVLREDARQLAGLAFDPGGRLAFVQRVEGLDLVVHRVDAQGHLHEVVRCRYLARCGLLASTDPAGNPLLRGDLGGSLDRLLSVDAHGGLHTVHADPQGEADLDTLTIDPASGQPVIASYRGTVAANYGLTPAMQRHVALIAAHFPGRNLGITVADGTHARWLVSERAGSLQGERWHLYDPRTGMFRMILDTDPITDRSGIPTHWLPESAMARKLPIAWSASDGMRLHGFLWLPPGANAARLPLIALVHGGPWNHTGPGYFGSGYSQFLVNRGFAVFEPNFRGSTGYGRDYMLAAHGDFGDGRVQRDIVEGVRYLLGQGIGDPQRVGIAGASFGGYSTLLGVTFDPALFKVGVAMVPPPDLAWDFRWIARSSEALQLSHYVPLRDWLRLLSLDMDDPTTMARLHAQSPLANAVALHRPLLLVASGEDHRVALRGVLGYAARLKRLGKDVTLMVDPQAGHTNAGPMAREAYLYLTALMLHQYLGGPMPAPPDASLRAYLERTMRLIGRGMQVPGAGVR